MKKIFNPLMLMLGAFALVTFTSCSKDDDPVIDPGTGGINVANGLYMTVKGEDPSSTAVLSAENVEADGFQSAARDGFVGGYMWLEAGDYNVVQITDKEVTATIGGTAEAVTDEASSCELKDYVVVTTAVDGPAVTVANSGLYRVTHDALTNELVLYQISKAGIIGSATPSGWGADTDLPGSVTADGGKWEATEVILRNGEWKLRFNCRWSINRRIDPNGPYDDSNGYQLFTNFGGEANDLKNGNDGPNIAQGEDGEYTVTVEWDPRVGWSANAERTGDAPVIAFDPNDYNWGVIGDATAGGWDADRNMLYKSLGDDGHAWYGVVTLGESGAFKFRTNDSWDLNLGGALAADGMTSALSAGGDNISNPGAGDYYIVITTADEGTTWNATMTENGWAIIGEGGPAASWETDTYFNADGFADGVTTYSYTGDFTTGGWKIRAGGAWDLNLGGNLGGLVLDGGNLGVSEAGTYKITMTFDGANYVGSAEKQ